MALVVYSVNPYLAVFDKGEGEVGIGPPINLTATPVTNSIFELNWDDNPNNASPADSYTISRAGQPDVIITAPTTTYQDTRNIVAGELITWTVTLTNADGTSSGAQVSFQVPDILALFSAPLQDSLIPVRAVGSPTPTFSRSSDATLVDYKGTIRTVAAGTPRFLGARLDPDNTTYHTTRDDGSTPIDQTDFYADAAGPYGYVSESASTNTWIFSEDATSPEHLNTITTVDTNVAPSGEQTADTVTVDAVGGTAASGIRRGRAVSPDTDYCLSAYFKPGNTNWVRIQNASFDENFSTWFDLANGVIGTQQHTDAGIEALGNGWYRCWIVFQSTNDTNGNVTLWLANSDGSSNVPRDGIASFIVWGVQFEASSFPTSYIKTEAASATRSAESLTYDEVGNMENAAGTAFAQVSSLWAGASGNSTIIGRDITLLYRSNGGGSNLIQADTNSSGASSAPSGTTYQNVDPQDAAGTWGGAVTAYYQGNPDLTPEAYGGTVGINDIGIGCRNTNDQQWNGTIRNVKIYDVELTESQVGELPGPVTP